MANRESRRRLLQVGSLAAGGILLGSRTNLATNQEVAQRFAATTDAAESGISILMPRDRVPLSFIIDDSTCLVNMGHFCTPQFAACYPERAEYQKAWKAWPREIPDAFVREFGEWCSQHGVKGKYSIVPNPACVGWLDRELPGWSRQELTNSIDLVRELMLPNWDIHPEMITHTRVIDLKTGRPMSEINPATMENSFPQTEISVDYLAEYLAYALRILKNCGLPCEGVTTPGGFGNRVKTLLPVAVAEAVRDVFPDVQIPHYFKYVELDSDDTEPRMEGIEKSGPQIDRFTMNVPAGTGDWFGGWQGDIISQPDKYASTDGLSGRMIHLIENRKPAVMLCHWPGMYSNGSKKGFEAFKRVVTSISSRFADETMWMKTSEMAIYWAVKQLAHVQLNGNHLSIESPYSCPQFTIELKTVNDYPIKLLSNGKETQLSRVSEKRNLQADTYWADSEKTIVSIDLPAGASQLEMTAVTD